MDALTPMHRNPPSASGVSMDSGCSHRNWRWIDCRRPTGAIAIHGSAARRRRVVAIKIPRSAGASCQSTQLHPEGFNVTRALGRACRVSMAEGFRCHTQGTWFESRLSPQQGRSWALAGAVGHALTGSYPTARATFVERPRNLSRLILAICVHPRPEGSFASALAFSSQKPMPIS